MNIATHQEKEKNDKTGKRKEGKDRPILKRLSATLLRLFKGVVQGAARRKNGLCEGSARGNWDPREGQQSF